MTQFKGFPVELFRYLEELAANNNREWFNTNKQRYLDDVVEPVLDFIEAVGDHMDTISEHFVADTRRNGGSMFRIYRDVRFSRDKRPYKENVGCHFRHEAGKSAHAPGFYLHLQPDNVFVGAGVWTPPNPVLDKIRTAIVEPPEKWQAVIHNKRFLKRFSDIEGERLKRPPRGYDPEHRYVEDLKLKSLFVKCHLDDDFVTSPKFFNEVMNIYKDAIPLMEFVTTAVGLRF